MGDLPKFDRKFQKSSPAAGLLMIYTTNDYTLNEIWCKIRENRSFLLYKQLSKNWWRCAPPKVFDLKLAAAPPEVKAPPKIPKIRP